MAERLYELAIEYAGLTRHRDRLRPLLRDRRDRPVDGLAGADGLGGGGLRGIRRLRDRERGTERHHERRLLRGRGRIVARRPGRAGGAAGRRRRRPAARRALGEGAACASPAGGAPDRLRLLQPDHARREREGARGRMGLPARARPARWTCSRTRRTWSRWRSWLRDEGLPDDRGPGGRLLGRLGGARPHLRGERPRGPFPLRPLPVGVRRLGPRLARRLGDDLRARGRHGADQARDDGLAGDASAVRRCCREDGRDRRPRLGRARRARSRRRLERGRARRATAFRSRALGERMDLLEEQLEIVSPPVDGGRVLVRRGGTTGSNGAGPSRSRCSARTRRWSWAGPPARARAARRPLGRRVQHRLRHGGGVSRATGPIAEAAASARGGSRSCSR